MRDSQWGFQCLFKSLYWAWAQTSSMVARVAHSNMPHTVTMHLSKHPHKTQVFSDVASGNNTKRNINYVSFTPLQFKSNIFSKSRPLHLVLWSDWLSARQNKRESPPKCCVAVGSSPVGWARCMLWQGGSLTGSSFSLIQWGPVQGTHFITSYTISCTVTQLHGHVYHSATLLVFRGRLLSLPKASNYLGSFKYLSKTKLNLWYCNFVLTVNFTLALAWGWTIPQSTVLNKTTVVSVSVLWMEKWGLVWCSRLWRRSCHCSEQSWQSGLLLRLQPTHRPLLHNKSNFYDDLW